MSELFQWVFSETGLPLVFLGLMGISMLIYAVLDGYDLGVGILMATRPEAERDTMIASIGPFWDANETWLVLGVGILLVAFPIAHGQVFGALYFPVSLMLVGLILRGVAFDFRAKSKAKYKHRWDVLFSLGSLVAALTQGYMLGKYIVGFSDGAGAMLFSIISAVCVTAAYVLMGASWLIMKTENGVQARAVNVARIMVPVVLAGLVLVSVVNPFVSERIFDRWFVWPQVALLALLPIATLALLFALWQRLGALGQPDVRHTGANQSATSLRRLWLLETTPFILCIGVFVLAFAGLAYSFYPYIIPGTMTVWDAASARESLTIILWGCFFVLPAIAGYTALSYWIFRGKTRSLSYV